MLVTTTAICRVAAITVPLSNAKEQQLRPPCQALWLQHSDPGPRCMILPIGPPMLRVSLIFSQVCRRVCKLDCGKFAGNGRVWCLWVVVAGISIVVGPLPLCPRARKCNQAATSTSALDSSFSFDSSEIGNSGFGFNVQVETMTASIDSHS